MSAERWLKECIDATSSLSVSVVHRHDLVALLSIFGKLSYDESLILASVREDMVNESTGFPTVCETLCCAICRGGDATGG